MKSYFTTNIVLLAILRFREFRGVKLYIYNHNMRIKVRKWLIIDGKQPSIIPVICLEKQKYLPLRGIEPRPCG